MTPFSTRTKPRILFAFIAGLLFTHTAQSQSPTLGLADFVMLAGNGGSNTIMPANGQYGVQIGSSITVVGGSVGAYTLVQTTGNATINANIFSRGWVSLTNSNVVSGRITAANPDNLYNPALLVGSSTNIGGNIDVNGNIIIGGGTVMGAVTHPPGTTYTGPLPANGEFEATPTLPVFPALPAITSFPAAGTADITGTAPISPGEYRDIILTGNKTITLQGPGTYTFRSVHLSGNSNRLTFDFQNQAAGNFYIYVHEDADFGKLNSTMANGGSASRIYTEVHGTGATSSIPSAAFVISNGSSGGGSKWLGTVWAPYATVHIGSGTGSSNLTGALFSGTQVNIQSGVTLTHAPFLFCTNPTVNAGNDVSYTCPSQNIQLQSTTNIANPVYSWTTYGKGAILSGGNTATPTVRVNGFDSLNVATFKLTVSDPNGACSAEDSVVVSYVACVYPTIIPTAKTTTIIGSELTSLYNDPDQASGDIFLLNDEHTRVMIEIIAVSGQQNSLYTLLTTDNTLYGLTDTIGNALTPLIITGSFPIANLINLNALTTKIVYARPLYHAVNNTGLISSQGDNAMRTNFLRGGYLVDGDSIPIGVISDSYNKKGTAHIDIQNGDLPGNGNPDGNTEPIQVLGEYPFAGGSDEGRAMLQIVHDVAPKSPLYFRTGFVTAGDFAFGITQLADAGCKVIVDDVSFITESFFQDGVIAQTVNQVVAQGVSYFSAAGNFGKKSYTHSLNPAAAGYTLPAGVVGVPHDFGGGDIYQRISLKGTTLLPGKYTLVLQWQDEFYSQGQLGGTDNDLDIYLVNQYGTAIGFNRDNTGGDPLEVLFFTVTMDTEADILIVRANGSSALSFKFIAFRGDLTFQEHISGQSTIVGQPNAEGAIAVGAVLYSNTPTYGVNPPTIASFSSRGGMIVNNVNRNKPEITAPNGVNTSIQFGSINLEGDAHPNFFGTSCSAPHAAAAAALLIHGRKKFTGHVMTPAEVKSLITSSAINMGGPGYDDSTGYGFLQPYIAMNTFARPTAVIDSLTYPATITPTNLPTSPFTLYVHGQYLSTETQIVVRGEFLPTTISGDTLASATVDPFTGNPTIQLYTPPIANGDGGYSNTLSFFSIDKKDITITANSTTKTYSAPLPAFTATILVDGQPLSSTTLTLADLGLTTLTFETQATAESGIGTYLVRPVRDFDSTDPADIPLLEIYNYEFVDGSLTIEPLAIQVTPVDQTIDYGNALTNIEFTYTRLDGQPVSADLQAKLDSVHKKYLADNILGIVSGYPGSPPLTEDELANLSTMVSFQAVKNARKFTLENGVLVPLASGTNTFDVQYLVDVSAQSLRNYVTDSATAILEAAYPGVNSRSLISANALVKGTAQANLNGNLVQMVNGTLVQMVNSATGTFVPILNGNLVQMVNGTLVQLVNGQPIPVPNAEPVQFANGNLVQLVNGELVPIANGNLVQLVNGTLVQMVNGNLVQLVNGQSEPVLNGNLVQIVNGTLVQLVNGVEVPVANGTLVQMVNGTLVQLVNGNLVQMVNGTLVQLVNGNLVQIVNGNLVQIVNGVTYEIVNGTLVQLVNGQLQFVSSYAVGNGNNDNTAVIVDQADFSLQNGSIGAQFAANLVTGLDPGTHRIFPGALIDPNFKVTYVSGTLTVNAVPITITANNRSKVYGQALSLGTQAFTVTSGTLVEGDSITGVTLTSAGAAASALVGGSPYPIVPSKATGIDTGFYAVTYMPGNLTVSAAPFTAKANDAVIFFGDNPPNYTGTLTGLVNGDQATYNYTSTYTNGMPAGVYPITPVQVSFAKAANYAITLVNGTLYVNPKGSGAKKLRPYLDCVQEVTNPGPGEFPFIAHYFCENPNSTPVYVPIGIDNRLRSANGAAGFDGSNQPVLFMPGTTTFNVPFDGSTLTWEIRTFESNHKASVASTASSSSSRCSFTTGARISDDNTGEIVNEEKNILVYPNPATRTLTIQSPQELLNVKQMKLFDVTGRHFPVKANGSGTGKILVLDIAMLPPGIYLLRQEGTRTVNVFRFVKL